MTEGTEIRMVVVCETKAQVCSYVFVIMPWTSSPSPITAGKHMLPHMGEGSFTGQTQLRAETVC